MDTSVPHSARVWNYWLGGRDNYAVDRRVGDQVRAVFPEIVDAARETRAFLRRAVAFLNDAGVRQFLDVGSGLPAAGNTHELVAPGSRTVYVDNDPLVLAHARELLHDGDVHFIDGDLRDADALVERAGAFIDDGEPVALLMLGVMGHVEDPDEARAIVGGLAGRLPAGSYLVMSDGTATSERVIESHRQYNESGAVPYHLREVLDFEAFFEGLELVAPGVVPLTRWRPGGGPVKDVDGYAGVAAKTFGRA
ncbi:O-Methyltransferase involved in polyketide biosynthesis [Paractinoplanes atraurantiacus]|uniref:O-Methyltransferase involved in polyketide biosynthesis n=1 Tax=Paractinoplanes atraurantiacus TaxID=1036182 RepID=A0A285IXK6_9ACTN|nr:O-Methyltransferase involved in polyketide biosynthesis [Actinoplanes atraurantiacus]